MLTVGIGNHNVYADEASDLKESREKEILLRGYNALSGLEISKNDAFGAFIIDKDNEEYKRYINRSIDFTDGGSKSFTSSSLHDVATSFSEQLGLDIYGSIFVVDMNLKAQFNTSTSLRNIVSQKYDFYTAWIYRYNYTCDLNVSKIREYLSENFKNDLYAVNSSAKAEELFRKYGTHLFTGVTYGGRINVTNYMTTNSSSFNIYEGKNLEGKIQAASSAAGLGAGFSFEEKFTSDENNEYCTSNYSCQYYGGNAPSALTIDALLDSSYGLGDKKTYQYDIFFEGIRNKENLMVVAIPSGASAIPLWELLDENNIDSFNVRRYLIETYTNLCNEQYENYLNEVAPTKVVVPDTNPSAYPTLKGIYVKTPQNYMYYVEKKDLEAKGAHSVLHEGDVIYLDIKNDDNKEIKLDCNNCVKIDEKLGVIKIEGRVGGDIEISFVEDDKVIPWIKCELEKHIFEGGTGTEEYPYIIIDKEQFKKIQNNLLAHYTLYKDIDFSGDSEGIDCLGEFNGVLDGNYCKISNLKIKKSKNWGLFSVNKGTIKNLTISGAGSSLFSTGFSEGGIDYRNDYRSDNYEAKSIYALNSGIICGENKSVIENCNLEDIFIRDVIKNINYAESGTHIMKIGAICGINTGTIKGCMVSRPRILGSFINLKEKLDGHVYVYCGGLCGENNGGVIDSCVVDLSSEGSIYSQCYNMFGKGSETSGIRAYSGGMVGYCDNNVDIRYSYVNVRSVTNTQAYSIIDCDYKTFSEKLGEYNSLRSTSCICSVNCNLNGKSNIVIRPNTNDGSELKIDCIRPKGNGDNISGSSSAYETVNSEANFTEGSKQKIDAIGDYSKSFQSDSSNLGIKHVLQLDRKQVMSIELDSSQGLLRSVYYDGQIFTPSNIHIKRYINDSDNEDLKVYKIMVYDKNQKNKSLIDTPFALDKPYCVEFTLYDGSNTLSVSKDLSVENTKIIGIEATDAKSIFIDEIYDYKDNWKDKVELSYIYSDGSRKKVTDVSDIDARKITSSFEPEKVSVGDNLITVELKTNNINVKCSYVLTIENRQITEIILNPDLDSEDYKKRSFEAGTKISKDKLEGLYVELVYSEGDNKVIDSLAKDTELEIIDGTAKEDGIVTVDGVEYERNYIVLASKDYGYSTKLKLNVDAKKSTDIPTSTPTDTVTPTEEITPTVDPVITDTITPTPVVDEDDKDKKKKEQDWSWIIWVGLCVAIIVVVGIVWKSGVLTKKKETKEKKISDIAKLQNAEQKSNQDAVEKTDISSESEETNGRGDE